MNREPSVEAWTWGDQLGSPRYWALLAATMLSALAGSMFWGLVPLLARYAGYGAISWIYLAHYIASPLAILFAWRVARGRGSGALLAAAAVQLAGCLILLALPGSSAAAFASATLISVGVEGLALGVPVAVVGGRGGARDYVLAVGTIWVLASAFAMAGSGLGAAFSDRLGIRASSIVEVALVFIAAVALLCAGGRLFSDPPPRRDVSLETVSRAPVAVALLAMIVPFYWCYWMYRAHGEAARLAPSRRLLRPGGALTMALLAILIPLLVEMLWLRGMVLMDGSQHRGGLLDPEVLLPLLLAWLPFITLLPLLLATLVEELNAAAEAMGWRRVGHPALVLVLGILLLPVAMALVQAALERMASLAAAREEPWPPRKTAP